MSVSELRRCIVTQLKKDRVREYSDYTDRFKNSITFITEEDISSTMKLQPDKYLKVTIDYED